MTLPSILIVDDEPDNFDVIEAFLNEKNYQLYYVSSGQEAIDSLEAFKPDVILLDVMIPGMDGVEICQHIKALPQWQAVPIIMVTALTAKEELARCFQAGADDFIRKPVNGVELRARVHSMLRIKKQYDDLQTLLKSQEEMLRLRADMSDMIVHDLRNPLTNILLASALFNKTGLSEKQLKKLSQISRAGEQIKMMIDSLLLMAKIESGKMFLNPIATDVSDLGKALVTDFELIAEEKRIVLVSELPDPGQLITLDPVVFRRIVENLLSNALKFSPYGSQVQLKIDYPPESRVRVQVIDVGQGVSTERQQQIFEKFEIGNLLKETSQIGLGLAFCKIAVEAQGGKLTLTSNKPKGSIFTVEL